MASFATGVNAFLNSPYMGIIVTELDYFIICVIFAIT